MPEPISLDNSRKLIHAFRQVAAQRARAETDIEAHLKNARESTNTDVFQARQSVDSQLAEARKASKTGQSLLTEANLKHLWEQVRGALPVPDPDANQPQELTHTVTATAQLHFASPKMRLDQAVATTNEICSRLNSAVSAVLEFRAQEEARRKIEQTQEEARRRIEQKNRRKATSLWVTVIGFSLCLAVAWLLADKFTLDYPQTAIVTICVCVFGVSYLGVMIRAFQNQKSQIGGIVMLATLLLLPCFVGSIIAPVALFFWWSGLGILVKRYKSWLDGD